MGWLLGKKENSEVPNGLSVITCHSYNKVKKKKNISDDMMKKVLTENLE